MTTEEIINRHLSHIDEHFANGDYAALFQEAQALYKASEGRNAYFMGVCYLNAWGTGLDNDRAIPYLKEAAAHKDNYEYSTYLLGIAYYRKMEYIKAVEWFTASQEAGNNGALVYLADSAAAYALTRWNEVRNYFSQPDFVMGVDEIKGYMNTALKYYLKAAELAPETMNNLLWCGFGKIGILAYNLSTSGCLELYELRGNSLSGIVSSGLEIMSKKWDYDSHDKILAIAVSICDVMKKCDVELIAESFRAFLSLLDCERHHSAEAFYRARWHMKRVGELRKVVGELTANEVAGQLKDRDFKYNVLEKKYGATVLSMMRAGKLPDLQRSYGEGRVPEVESCESFMEMFRHQQAIASKAAEKSNSNSLTGFLKNIFKL